MNLEIEKEQLIKSIEQASERVFRELFANREHFYYCVLLTTGEGLPPCISAWSWEALERVGMIHGLDYAKDVKWSYADSPYYAFGDNYFENVKRLFYDRENIHKLDEEEFEFRLQAMEEAMKRLDAKGIFALNQPRNKVYINVELMPPDSSNTKRALRLNQKGNITDWLEEASEE